LLIIGDFAHCVLLSVVTVSGNRVKHLSKSLEFVVQLKESSSVRTVDELRKWLRETWCQKIQIEKMNDLWIEIGGRKLAKTATSAKHHLALCMVSLGAFTSPGRYVCH